MSVSDCYSKHRSISEEWSQSVLTRPVNRIDKADHHSDVPSLKIQQSNLSDDDVNILVSMCGAYSDVQVDLSVDERRNADKNIAYANNVIFGSISSQRLQQVKQIETAYGTHYLQGQTNYCGYCCVANSFVHATQDTTSVKEMDTIADRLWMQMLKNPSLGLTAELEPMRDREGFYSVEVLKATLEAHGFELNKIDERALVDMCPLDVGSYIVSNLQEQLGMASIIIRKRNHQHWINISVQGSTPILKDSQQPLPKPLTMEQLGDIIRANLECPGAVFFLSRNVTTAAHNRAPKVSISKAGTLNYRLSISCTLSA